MKGGDRRALARLMTLAENEAGALPAIFTRIHRDLGKAHRVGVTGPPGAGKSTLVGRLIESVRAAGETVGVVAVDPSSPITGGALLGDRIRMPAAADPGVFVRSMASRGSAGGLARQSLDVADLLDAFGHHWIFIETVGTGQGELEVAAEADTTVVVLHPGSGDAVQALKAGLFEIGDVFVVNKADQVGGERLKAELDWAFHLNAERPAPPVLLTSAVENRGIDELVEAVRRLRAQRESDGALETARASRVRHRLQRQVVDAFSRHLERDADWERRLDELTHRVMKQEIDRYTAYESLARDLMRRLGATRGESES